MKSLVDCATTSPKPLIFHLHLFIATHKTTSFGRGYPQGNAGSGQNLSGFSQTFINATSGRETAWAVTRPPGFFGRTVSNGVVGNSCNSDRLTDMSIV